jgi:uncharacterized membrane protein YeiB
LPDDSTAAPTRTPGTAEAVAATRRIRGIDLARAMAIIGMVAVHFTLSDPAGAGGESAALPTGPHGRAAILFGLLAGVGITLLDRSRSASRPRTRQKLLWRAAILLPLGLVLQALDHGIAVILQNYALLFVVGMAAIALTDRALVAAAGILLVLGPAVHVAAETAMAGTTFGEPAALGVPPAALVLALLLTSTYPLVTWSAPLLVGMVIGRLDLLDARVQARVLAVSTVLALALLWGGAVLAGLVPAGGPSWAALAVDPAPHSQSFVWLWQATAAAVAALAACLVLTELAPRLLSPLVALGQLALTVYVGHLLLIAAAPARVRVDDVAGAGVRVLAFTAFAALFAWAWRLRFRRGPLESALDAPLALRDRVRARRMDASGTASPDAADRGTPARTADGDATDAEGSGTAPSDATGVDAGPPR